MRRAASGVSVELRKAARTPAWRNAATWSCMSAISGETTMPVPARAMEGIWKHKDLPPPVGMSTSASPPRMRVSITSACGARKCS